MPQADRRWEETLKRAALAALMDAASTIPGVDPFLKAAETVHRELTAAEVSWPEQARQAVQAFAEGYRALLREEGNPEVVEPALAETFFLLDRYALTPDALARQNLDAERAARRTMQAASSRLELLDEAGLSLVQRLLGTYYRVLLEHQEAWALPVARETLARLDEALARCGLLLEAVAAIPAAMADKLAYAQAWDHARWPVLPYPYETLYPEVLRAEYRFIPYEGSTFEAMRDDLIAWAQELARTDPPLGLRFYVGPGGAGKTRLVVEAGEQLRERGWLVAFLDPGADWPAHADALLGAERPTLLALDYATAIPGATSALIEAMARVSRCCPFALVLLDRDVTTPLRDRLAPAMRPGDRILRLPAVETRLSPVDALQPDEAQALYAAAFARLKPLAERPPDRPPRLEALPERPLEVILLAWLAAAGERLPADPADPRHILAAVWGREKRLWKERWLHGEGLPERARSDLIPLIERLRALASLGLGWRDRDGLAAFLRGRADLFPMPATPTGPLHPVWLAGVLADFPWPRTEASLIPPVAPDPLADWVIGKAFTAQPRLIEALLPSGQAAAADPQESARILAEALLTLERATGRFPELQALSVPLARTFADWAKAGPLDGEGMRTFLDGLAARLPAPDRTLVLRAVQEPLYRRMADLAPDKAGRARALNSLGNALSALGRREEALAATQEAADLYRGLAQAAPQAFRPDLAGSLNNLGNRLSDLGRREEALAATQEAADLYRGLAEAAPQAFLPDLAMSLNNLGNTLSDLGRREEALAAHEEATDLYRGLAEAAPQAFLPDLAASLNNLGYALSALGQREEALAATQEAVSIRRGLAEAAPQAFLPDLATSLNNLGRDLSALGRREEALAATQEAVSIRRELAEAAPQAFRPDLAASLNNLGNTLSALGRREEALAATQEAVDIYRELAEAAPQAFRPDLAMSLNNLGSDLSALGRREEALAAHEEATDLYRELAEAAPQAFLPGLATSLNNLGAMLSALGRREEALAATQEAADLYCGLAEAAPQAFWPDLAGSLNNLGNRLSALGRREEALAATQEAADLYRELAKAAPQAFRPDLARSLNNLGLAFSALGRREEALAAHEEAVRTLAPFFLRFSAMFADWMEIMVRNYRDACQAAGREPDGELLAPLRRRSP